MSRSSSLILRGVGLGVAFTFASGTLGAVRYCGIGNDQFVGDIPAALGMIQPCLNRPGDGATTAFNQPGSGILQKLLTAQQTCQPGDVFIVHYAGHGDTEGSPPEGDAQRGIISSLAGFNAGDVANDDQIANIINNFPTCCAVITIFDSCYSGEMIDDPFDINRGMVITTADNVCTAPGNSIFLPYWNSAFTPVMTPSGPSVGGDTNMDQRLTVGELFASLALITGGGHTSNPQAVNFYQSGDVHLDYNIWEIPSPGTFALMGIACLVPRRRR